MKRYLHSYTKTIAIICQAKTLATKEGNCNEGVKRLKTQKAAQRHRKRKGLRKPEARKYHKKIFRINTETSRGGFQIHSYEGYESTSSNGIHPRLDKH
jgi:hypothetical protein